MKKRIRASKPRSPTPSEQLGVFVSAAETARLTALAEDLRSQLTALTAEWEELMMQLEEQGAPS